MKRSILIVFGWIMLTFSTLILVSSTSGSPHETHTVFLPIIKNSLAPIIPDTTNVLNEATTQHLMAVSEDDTTFTFAQVTQELLNVQVGELIASRPTPLTPYGFLRKVTNIFTSNGQLILTTEQATIEEAVQQGEVHLQYKLSPEDIQESFLASGTTLIQKPQQTEAVFNYQIDDVLLYDADGNPNTVNDQIVANGDIALEIEVDFDLIVHSWHLEELQFIATVVETSDLTIESNIDESLIDEEITLATYYLAPIPVQIGIFPVTVSPQLTIFLGADGTVHAGVSAGITQEATLMAGLLYTNETWQSVNDFDNSFGYTAPTVTAELNVKAYVGAKVDLYISGIKGPYAKAKFFLQLEANPLASPWWELYAGLDVPIGVKVEIFSRTIVDYETKVIEYRRLLAQSNNITTWVKAYQDTVSGNALGSGAIIQPTSDGGYVVASSTYPMYPPPYGNISVLKLSADGNVIWRYEYGTSDTDTIATIRELPGGGYILLGTAESNTKIWLLKLNTDGSIVWQKTYAHHTYNRAASLTITNDGGYIVVGSTYNASGEDSDAWALKLNSDGTIAWQKLYGGTLGDGFGQIQSTTNGEYLAVGSTESLLWIVKLNTDGQIGWQKTYSLNASKAFKSSHEVSLSNGETAQIEPLAEGGYILSSGNQLLKIANDGTVIWSKRYQDAGFISVAETVDGSFLLTGALPSTEYPPSDDMWIAKTDSTGEILWQKSVGESASRTYWASSGTSDGDNFVVASSRSYGPGNYELLIIKLDSSGDIAGCSLCGDSTITAENVSFTTTVSSANSTNTTTVPENSYVSRQSVFTEVIDVCGE